MTLCRWIHLPGRIPYEVGLGLQEALVAHRLGLIDAKGPGKGQDVLLLLEHQPVYTAGRRESDMATLEAEGRRLRAFGADYFATQRGGQTTYHGPGQLIGYPIFDLNALSLPTRQFVHVLESSFLRRLVESVGVSVYDSPHVGLFTNANSKIASIGLQLRRRITSHGFALNIQDDVQSWFGNIVACGLDDVHATSIESERRRLGLTPTLSVLDVVPMAVAEFGRAYGRPMAPLEKDPDPILWDMVKDAIQAANP